MLSQFLVWASVGWAQDTIDIGRIRDEEITVVQKLLYPKDGRTEFGVHIGVMPFDAYVTSPNAAVSIGVHLSETLAISVVAGGGYSFKSGVYRELESPTFGVAPNAYRYLGSALGGIEWSPIYAKLNLNGSSIVHFDVYFPLRAGATLEESLIPGGGRPIAPTLSPGIGGRFFLGKTASLKVELRDDLLLQPRSVTGTVDFKQNANITAGLVFFTGRKDG